MQLRRDNHFVPRFLLKPWTSSGGRIWVYRILVSHGNVPPWTQKPIDSVAFRRDLYTLTSGGEEVDDFERWLEREFETPATGSLARAIDGQSLSSLDWQRLAMLLAVQDVRTPASLVESMKRWDKEIPEILDSTLKRALAELEDYRRRAIPLPEPTGERTPLHDVMDVKIEPPKEGETHGVIEASVVVGRKLWLASQHQVLTSASRVLLDHKWSIAEPAPGTTWFTSDHPVVRLKYFSEDKYDFEGGWGRHKGDLMMPLSPQHLLFTTVGQEAPDRFTFSEEKTREIQQILAKRAHRCIFANRRMRKVEWFRPRHVDAEMVKSEAQEWANYHSSQSKVE